MVDVIHWNPRRYRARGPLHRLPAIGPRMNNFGDLLGPLIVSAIEAQEDLVPWPKSKSRLLTVGSILTLAKRGDVVWGTGVNGKSVEREISLTGVDIRAVRGPLTQEWARSRGASVPDVYGDPALLLGALIGREKLRGQAKSRRVAIVPNFHDYQTTKADRSDVLDPRMPLPKILQAIASSDFVCGSSLHGVIVAESLGIPARFVSSAHEPRFKYDDYMLGTKRPPAEFASSALEAIEMGPQSPLDFDPTALLASFPRELWKGRP